MFRKKKTGEEKFAQAVKDFIKYMEEKYTEDNVPNNLSWLFEHLFKGFDDKHFESQISKIVKNKIRVRNTIKEILGEDRAKEVLNTL